MRWLLVVATSGLALLPFDVRADMGPKLPDKALWISPGFVLGGSKTIDGGTKLILGGELSAGYWRRMGYVGGVIDGLYDWHRDTGRIMVGPVVGLGPIGLDGGYLVEFPEGGPRHGGAVRLFVTIGIMGFFVRYGALRDAPDFVDFGLFIKAPIPLRATWPARPRPMPTRPPSRPAPATSSPTSQPSTQP